MIRMYGEYVLGYPSARHRVLSTVPRWACQMAATAGWAVRAARGGGRGGLDERSS